MSGASVTRHLKASHSAGQPPRAPRTQPCSCRAKLPGGPVAHARGTMKGLTLHARCAPRRSPTAPLLLRPISKQSLSPLSMSMRSTASTSAGLSLCTASLRRVVCGTSSH
eukprot:UN3823